MGDAMMRTAILLCLGLAWGSPASAADFEFKGLALDSLVMPDQVIESLKVACEQAGKPCDEFWQKLHNDNAVKCGAGHQGKQVCNGRTTIAGEKAAANVVIGSGGRLERVWLTISNYAYEAAPKVERVEQNGVKRPGPGKCLEVWEYLDQYGNKTPKELKPVVAEKGWNENNALIELYGWRRFNSISGRVQAAA